MTLPGGGYEQDQNPAMHSNSLMTISLQQWSVAYRLCHMSHVTINELGPVDYQGSNRFL
jgi:hypothetical protein